MAAFDARLVAISPQLPEQSLSTAQADELTFHVLSDVGNKAAHRFGLVYALPEELRAALQSNNKALPGINGDESWELPVPATYVIARDGRIALAYIEVDYRKRLEPEALLSALLAKLHVDFSTQPEVWPFLHPGRSAAVRVGSARDADLLSERTGALR